MKAFDSFSIVYKVLICVGYFKLLNKPKSRFKCICHQMYRCFAFTVAVVYSIQHLLFIVQRRDSMKDVFDGMVLMIPHVNLLVKIITLNLQVRRIDKLNELINDSIFGANSKEDEELLLKNKTSMHFLSKFLIYSISFTALLWPTSHFALRYQDENTAVPSYVPFKTDTWGKFSLSVALEVVPVIWVGYGHIFLDCIVVTYYSQAEVQLKILKHNLEHFFDTNETRHTVLRYKDELDTDLKRQFVYYVQRFEKIAWYTKEIGVVFNPSMSCQFFSSTITLCMVVYQMSALSVASFPFMFTILMFLLNSLQIFLYCYFGNLVKYESQSIVCSLYMSDWLAASPQFRRLMWIAMLRWSRPLIPSVSRIIPLSHSTFIAIFRATYSLYTVLVRKNPQNE